METMTYKRYRYIREAWKRNPPTQVLIALRIGYKPPKEEEVVSAKNVGVLLRAMNGRREISG